MIGIFFSTDREASVFLRNYRNGRFDGLEEGDTIFDDHILVGITGVGKIKATLRTEKFMNAFKLTQVIHVGTCSALKTDESLIPGKLIGITQVFEGDRIELASPTYPRMPLSMPFKLPEATLVTQDHFVDEGDERNYWQRIADASDMEGYAMAYVIAQYGTPFNIVKVVVSNVLGETAEFRKHLNNAYTLISDFLLTNVLNGK